MLPAAGLQSAYAAEPATRPAAIGGDVALSGFEGDAASTSAGTSVATQREDGTLVADGLAYAVADGGLTLVGFDGLSEGEDAAKDITVPASVSVDGNDTSVVAVAIAEGNTAEGVVSLTLPQSIINIDTATLAAAFPNLASVEVAAPKASAPVAAGAAAIRAAYSSFGSVLYKNAWIATDGDASQTTLTKELVWAPPATVVARIPVECTSIAAGAFADVKDLKTVVCFGVMESIPQAQKADDGTVIPGSFTDEQIQTVNVIVPQTGTVVPDGDHVSASVAVTDDSTMDIKREAWWKSGFASDRITLGEVYGSTTNTLPVTEEGVLETAEAEVAYAPETTQNSSSRKAGIEPPESAIPTPVPDDDQLDSSESGLVFTHLADMTLSVSWKGDPTATPSHIDIPAYATINGVTYPVTEIAPEAFKGAVFLTSITIPESVTTISKGAFDGCTNLADVMLPATLESVAAGAFADCATLDWDAEPAPVPLLDDNKVNRLVPFQANSDNDIASGETSSYASTPQRLRFNTGSPITMEANGGASVLSKVFEDPNGSFVGARRIYRLNEGYRIRTVTAYMGVEKRNQPDFLLWAIDPDGAELGMISVIVGDRETDASVHYAFVSGDGLVGTDGYWNQYVSTGCSWLVFDVAMIPNTNEQLKSYLSKSQYGMIVYRGLYGAMTEGPLPASYFSGFAAPSIPEPKRDDYEFLGWTWNGQTEPTKDASGAFANGGEVTLTANWKEAIPETNYFFGGSPFDEGNSKDGATSPVIKVVISGSPGSVSDVRFEKNDPTGLINAGQEGGISFAFGSSEGSLDKSATLDGSAVSDSIVLDKFGDGQYGLWVKADIDPGVIDSSKFVKSYTKGDYVASLVRLNYTFTPSA